jgi:predicted RNA polymerase sigma factor
VVTLNRIAATVMHEGPLVALNELRKVEDRLAEVRYYMYPAVAAEIHSRLGHKKKAALYYSLALELARTKAERDLLQKRLSLLS